MATIRKWLDQEGFDWQTGSIVWHRTDEKELPSEAGDEWDYRSSPGCASRIAPGESVPADHEILDVEFRDGYGGPMCPRFIAMDWDAIYFPYQYDGSTGLVKVFKSLSRYIGEDAEPTPYPGG